MLERIAKSGKPQAGLAAGALAGLSAAFTACTVLSVVSLLYTEFSHACCLTDGMRIYRQIYAVHTGAWRDDLNCCCWSQYQIAT